MFSRPITLDEHNARVEHHLAIIEQLVDTDARHSADELRRALADRDTFIASDAISAAIRRGESVVTDRAELKYLFIYRALTPEHRDQLQALAEHLATRHWNDDRTSGDIDTWQHIDVVRSAMQRAQQNLAQRALRHDASKLVEPERSGFASAKAKLSGLIFGSAEYAANCAELDDVLAHHYERNDHHPQHYINGIEDMSLLSLLEMFCDWYAAGQRTKDGSIAHSIAVNAKRFVIHPQLVEILCNTAIELGWAERTATGALVALPIAPE